MAIKRRLSVTIQPPVEEDEAPWKVYLARFVWLAMLAVGIAGFVGSFPGWLAELDAGHPGCEIEFEDGIATVEAAHWPGAPCDQADIIGATVLAIDGVHLDVDMDHSVLMALVEQEPSSVHEWSVERDGEVRQVFLAYEQGPLAHALENQGDARADVLVAGIAVLGAFARTLVFSISAFLLLRVGWSSSVPLLFSGSLLAFALGIGFQGRVEADWYPLVYDLSVFGVIIGMATALATLPGERVRSKIGLGIAVVWVAMTALVLDPVLVPWEAPSWRLQGQLLFLVAGTMVLAHRYLYECTVVERNQLRWVIVGFLVAAAGLFPRAVPILSPSAAEFHLDLIYPLSLTVTPLALVNALYRNDESDLSEVLRNTLLVGVLVGFACIAALVGAEIVPGVLHLLHAEPDVAFPGWTEPVAIFGGAVVLTVLLGRPLARVTDVALFPNRVTAPRAIAEAREALQDCWDLDEISWCARSTLKFGFDATGAQILRWDDRGWRSLVESQAGVDLDPPHRLALERGESIDVYLTGGSELSTMILPLLSHGGLVGALVAPPPAGHAYTEADRKLLREVAPAFGDAVWRNTRT